MAVDRGRGGGGAAVLPRDARRADPGEARVGAGGAALRVVAPAIGGAARARSVGGPPAALIGAGTCAPRPLDQRARCATPARPSARRFVLRCGSSSPP